MMRTPQHSRVFFNITPKECEWCGSKLGFLFGNHTPPVCLNCSMEHK